MNLNKLLLLTLFGLCLVLNSTSQTSETKLARNVAAGQNYFRASAEKSQFRQLQEFLSESVNNFKLDFHRSFEASRIKRKQKDDFLYALPEKGGQT